MEDTRAPATSGRDAAAQRAEQAHACAQYVCRRCGRRRRSGALRAAADGVRRTVAGDRRRARRATRFGIRSPAPALRGAAAQRHRARVAGRRRARSGAVAQSVLPRSSRRARGACRRARGAVGTPPHRSRPGESSGCALRRHRDPAHRWPLRCCLRHGQPARARRRCPRSAARALHTRRPRERARRVRLSPPHRSSGTCSAATRCGRRHARAARHALRRRRLRGRALPRAARERCSAALAGRHLARVQRTVPARLHGAPCEGAGRRGLDLLRTWRGFSRARDDRRGRRSRRARAAERPPARRRRQDTRIWNPRAAARSGRTRARGIAPHCRGRTAHRRRAQPARRDADDVPPIC